MPVEIPADRPAAATLAVAPGAMLKQRFLTVLVVLPLLLAALFLLPNAAWALLTSVPLAIGAIEWSRLAGFGRGARNAFVALIVTTCMLFVAAIWLRPTSTHISTLASALYLVSLLFWTVAVPAWLYFKWRVTNLLVLALTGWIVLVPAWLAMVALQKSAWLLLAVLLVVWIADTAAYFAGKRFGRHKLAPQISPGKSWEGVAGAYIALLVYALVLSVLLQPHATAWDRTSLLLFVALAAVFSIVGDLFESWIKRQAGAKDSGQLLPGHGGVLDRIDSLTAALPFAALYFIQAAQ